MIFDFKIKSCANFFLKIKIKNPNPKHNKLKVAKKYLKQKKLNFELLGLTSSSFHAFIPIVLPKRAHEKIK